MGDREPNGLELGNVVPRGGCGKIQRRNRCLKGLGHHIGQHRHQDMAPCSGFFSDIDGPDF